MPEEVTYPDEMTTTEFAEVVKDFMKMQEVIARLRRTSGYPQMNPLHRRRTYELYLECNLVARHIESDIEHLQSIYGRLMLQCSELRAERDALEASQP